MLEVEELEMLIFIIDDIDPMMYNEDDYQFIERIKAKLKDMQQIIENKKSGFKEWIDHYGF